MKLDVDLSALWACVDRMGAQRQKLDLDEIWDDSTFSIDTELESGIEIKLEDLETDQGLLGIHGRQVVLFIPDHAFRVETAIQSPGQGNKFHVADCKTLDDMKNRKRFERYHVTNSLTGEFPVFGYSQITKQQVEGNANLSVCKNCLNFLNYKGADTGTAQNRQMLVDEFSIEEFFSTYSSVFKQKPKSWIDKKTKGYTADWKAISDRVRATAGYCCKHCFVNLSSHKHLLHVHHINGVKSDNSESNLISLCADCHRKEPYHEHMMVPRKDTLTINELRKAQFGSEFSEWGTTRKSADPAVAGFLNYIERKNYVTPVLGYSVTSNANKGIVLDAAWPDQKLGLFLDGRVSVDGWTIFSLGEALEWAKGLPVARSDNLI